MYHIRIGLKSLIISTTFLIVYQILPIHHVYAAQKAIAEHLTEAEV